MILAAILIIWTVLAFFVGMVVGVHFRMMEERERVERVRRYR